MTIHPRDLTPEGAHSPTAHIIRELQLHGYLTISTATIVRRSGPCLIARTKRPDMVLLRGASPKSAELIASKWANERKVTQLAFRPDWIRHGKAAPFQRNDQLLLAMPIGLIAFPGSGTTDNFAD